MEAQEDDDVTEIEAAPIVVGNVDYCLLCGHLAVLYDLGGNIIKREEVEMELDVTYQKLFEYTCQSLGMRKNSRILNEWNFDSCAFPFCPNCELLMRSLATIYRQKEQLQSTIKNKMFEAENKYVREKLYDDIEDCRYLNFRKQALGDLFRGDEFRKRQRTSQRGNIKTESTTCLSTNPVVKDEELAQTEPNHPAHTPLTPFKEEPQSHPQRDNEEWAKSTVPTRRSLRVRKRNIKYLEEDVDDEDDKSFVNRSVYTLTENFDTGAATNVVADENTYERNHLRRGLKRKRQSRVQTDRGDESEENVDLKFVESGPRSGKSYYNDGDWEGTKRASSRSKRERKRRTNERNSSTMTIKQDNEQTLLKGRIKSEGVANEETRQTQLKRRIKSEGVANEETRLKGRIKSANEETNEDVAGDKYKITPLVKDILSGNIYYRTLLFVKIKEKDSFQCSTCSFFIPNNIDSKLRDQFHRHFLKNHSDRFQCQLCPEINLFQNDMELHQHFRHCHPGFQHIEPQIKCSQSRVAKMTSHAPPISSVKSEGKIQGQFSSRGKEKSTIQSKSCVICGKPGIPRAAYIDHRRTHMNREEKNAFLKTPGEKVIQEQHQKRRKRGPYGDSVGRGQGHVSENGCYWNMCDTCGQMISNGNRGMKEHVLTHQHQPTSSERRRYICPHCGWQTINKDYFHIHMKQHEGQAPFLTGVNCKYPNCNLIFQLENELKVHVEREHEEKVNQHMCKLCGRVFLNLQRLTAHGIVHTGERNFKCHVCQKSFSHSFVLKDHLSQVHGEGLTLKCPEEGCGAEFSTTYSFHSHLRRVHGIYKTELSPEKQADTGISCPTRKKSTVKELSPLELQTGREISLPLMQCNNLPSMAT